MVLNENVPQPQAFNTWSPDVVIIWGFGGATLRRKCVTGAGFESTYSQSTSSLLCFMPVVGMLASRSSWLPCLPAAMLIQHNETHPSETERNELFLQEVALITEFYHSNRKVTDNTLLSWKRFSKIISKSLLGKRHNGQFSIFIPLRITRPEYICCQGVLPHLSIQANGPQHTEAVWFHIREWEILKTTKVARKY